MRAAAVAAGCELWRPAKVVKVQLGGAGSNSLEVLTGGETRHALARWVVDASGQVLLPGLIDFHTHVYWGGTSLGVDAEEMAMRSGTPICQCHQLPTWALFSL